MDDSPGNNCPENLSWGTRRENVYDSIRNHGKHPLAAISTEDARNIRRSYTGQFGEKKRLAQQYGVSQSTIGRLIRRLTYSDELLETAETKEAKP